MPTRCHRIEANMSTSLVQSPPFFWVFFVFFFKLFFFVFVKTVRHVAAFIIAIHIIINIAPIIIKSHDFSFPPSLSLSLLPIRARMSSYTNTFPYENNTKENHNFNHTQSHNLTQPHTTTTGKHTRRNCREGTSGVDRRAFLWASQPATFLSRSCPNSNSFLLPVPILDILLFSSYGSNS